MNNIFKVVWSHALGQWCVVSELCRASKKRSVSRSKRQSKGGISFWKLTSVTVLSGISSMTAFASNTAILEDNSQSKTPYNMNWGMGSKTSTESIAIGKEATAEKGQGSIAIGSKSESNAIGTVAIGGSAKATKSGAVSIGISSESTGDYALSLGHGANASGGYSVSVGKSAMAGGSDSFALGAWTKAMGISSVALGKATEALGKGSVGIGGVSSIYKTIVTNDYGIGIGAFVKVYGDNSISIGRDSGIGMDTQKTQNAVAIGAYSKVGAKADQSIALGYKSSVMDGAIGAIASGDSNKVAKSGGIAIGRRLLSDGDNAIAIGSANKVIGASSVAIGENIEAKGSHIYVLGEAIKANLDNSVYLGAKSEATAVLTDATAGILNHDSTEFNTSNGTLHFGSYSAPNPSAVVTVGKSGAERRIQNVAAGLIAKKSTDAVNGSQLFATQSILSSFAGDVTNVLGGKASLANDGSFLNKPVYSVVNGEPAIGQTVSVRNIGDALNHLNTAILSPLKFSGDTDKLSTNTSNQFDRKLGSEIKIIGGNKDTTTLTENNIGVVSNGQDTLHIRLSKNLSELESATFSDNAGRSTEITKEGVVISNPSSKVKLNGTGLDNGSNKIINVASGLDGHKLNDVVGDTLSNAANISDLKTAINETNNALTNAGFGLMADDGKTVQKNLGDKITITGDKNIKTSVNKDGALVVNLNDKLDLGNDGSITIGNSLLSNDGLKITGGPAVTIDGINAGNKIITNVADGINNGDAVNLGQLNAGIQNAAGLSTWKLTTDGDKTEHKVSNQTVSVNHGLNTKVSAVHVDDKGNYNYQIDVTGIPVEYVDGNGNSIVNIGGKYFTQNRDPASGKVTLTPATPASVKISNDKPMQLTNVASGNISTDSKDAINGGQLSAAIDMVGGSNITYIDGKPALKKDTFIELSSARGGNIATDGSAFVRPSNVVTAVNALNKEGTKYFKVNSDGPAAKAEGKDSTAAGVGSLAAGKKSVALGHNSTVSSSAPIGSVSIGSGAKAERAHTGKYSVNGIVVAGKTGKDTPVVSFGSEGYERQIQHVAPGVLSETSTDAVNGSQLYAVSQQQSSNTKAISNLNNRVNRLDHRISELNRDIRGVGASAAAMSSIPQAYLPGKSLMGLGVGTYGGESALAIGVSRISDNGKVIMKLNAGNNSRGDYSVGAGIGFQW